MTQLVVLFDGGCPMCRRTVRRIRALDWRHRLRFVDAMDADARERIAPGLTEAAVLIQMYVVDQRGALRPGSGQARHAGFEAALQISRVVPLLWPLWFIGRLPGIRSLGHLVYRTIAANRVRRGRCTDDLCEPIAPGNRS